MGIESMIGDVIIMLLKTELIPGSWNWLSVELFLVSCSSFQMMFVSVTNETKIFLAKELLCFLKDILKKAVVDISAYPEVS